MSTPEGRGLRGFPGKASRPGPRCWRGGGASARGGSWENSKTLLRRQGRPRSEKATPERGGTERSRARSSPVLCRENPEEIFLFFFFLSFVKSEDGESRRLNPTFLWHCSRKTVETCGKECFIFPDTFLWKWFRVLQRLLFGFRVGQFPLWSPR